MKSENLDNLNRDELFAVIKGKCISRAKRKVYLGLVLLVLLIMLIIWFVNKDPNSSFFSKNRIDGIMFLVYIIFCCCSAGWIILYNYWFQKKIAHLDTPEQLLYCYEKKDRQNKIITYINSCVFLLLLTYPLISGGSTLLIIWVSALVIVLAIILTSAGIYLGKNNRRDKLLEKLQELVEKE